MSHYRGDYILRTITGIALFASSFAACGGSGGGGTDIPLTFRAVQSGQAVSCTSRIAVVGDSHETTIGMSDLRFFVSNLKYYDVAGNEISTTLQDNDFQFSNESGAVALVDLTSNTEGSCSDAALSGSEGTARVNNQVIARVGRTDIASVSFDVGVPQALMKSVLSSYTAEDAPSPLGELHWSWAGGYRHFVFNFTVTNNIGSGEGYLHVGSRDCGSNGVTALATKDECGLLNTPTVVLGGFNPASQTVDVDIAALMENVMYRTKDGNAGVACHSAPSQTDCAPVFSNLGVDMATGLSAPTLNRVFKAS